MKFTIAALILLASSLGCAAQNNLLLTSTGNLTTTSLGTFTSGSHLLQTSKGTVGAGIGYQHWRKNNGLSFVYTQSGYNAKLSTIKDKTLMTWPVTRYEETIVLEHRFLSSQRISPYVGSGVFVAILNGGKTGIKGRPASGIDGLYGVATTGGATLRVTRNLSLLAGMTVDFGKASTYGDQHYKSSPNRVYEPQVGLVWRLGRQPIK